jgi:hypothetical protein
MFACDGRGLGWFSLIVALTVTPVALLGFTTAQSAMDLWLACAWAAWAVLWFTYFLLLAVQMPIQRVTGLLTLGVGITTGWLPGLVLLYSN